MKLRDLSATYRATVHLTLGSRSILVGGSTPAQARDEAVAYAKDKLDWNPSAVSVGKELPDPRRHRGRVYWYGRDGSRWRLGGWCPACEVWAPREDAAPLAECECGAALWLSPADPGPANPLELVGRLYLGGLK